MQDKDFLRNGFCRDCFYFICSGRIIILILKIYSFYDIILYTSLKGMIDKMNETIKEYEKKIRILFIFRIIMWIICAGGCVYWIYWSFKLYEMEEFDAHIYATLFRPHFNIGISISIISITISLVLRLISDRHKRALKSILCEVRE